MHKIAFIQINKNPSSAELKELHRLLDAGTATVGDLPQVGDYFSIVENPLIVYECLRLDKSETTKLTPHPFEGHEATIYASMHARKGQA
ncbi:hypothetical protein [Xanthomonas campestris]|uniref:hypothetical protein n=1 Tax=Xanthomonas campestris TaxID=339 RepID=UPI003CF2A9E6